FGRRNRSLRGFLAMVCQPKPDAPKVDPLDGLLPLYLVEDQGTEIPLYSEKARQEYLAAQSLRVESEQEAGPVASSASAPVPPAATAPGHAPDGRPVREIELHEVKMLNKHLTRLRDEFALRAETLLPREVTGDEPPPRFVLHRDGESYPLLDLRALV